ncbi:GNAT family N-acetyltransferase [Amycolatopsis rhizosphaerae]|uniref:GNAT family N-acetyltransferase n=1 Tax=Amycolatopsis rhizosphaerae TaxID=2053003 RepID=UPI001C968D0E|nr:GNAT family N-acetyltransferase [Amycolatopsis rhizosphaerae]
MNVRPLHQDDIPAILDLMELGAPYVRTRAASDYWLYAHLFSTTCPVAVDEGQLAGPSSRSAAKTTPTTATFKTSSPMLTTDAAARHLHRPAELRPRGGQRLGCHRLYLTSEPENTAAHHTWTSRGITNVPGDQP